MPEAFPYKKGVRHVHTGYTWSRSRSRRFTDACLGDLPLPGEQRRRVSFSIYIRRGIVLLCNTIVIAVKIRVSAASTAASVRTGKKCSPVNA